VGRSVGRGLLSGRRNTSTPTAHRFDAGKPAKFNEPLHIGAARMGGKHQRAFAFFLPQQCEIAPMDARRVLLAMQRVSVIPHRNEPQSRCWCEQSRPVADDDNRPELKGAQKSAIPIRSRLCGIKASEVIGRYETLKAGFKMIEVAIVGHADDGTSTCG